MTVLWVGFFVFVLTMLALDLGVFHRKSKTVSPTSALRWTGVTVVMALLFAVAVYFLYDNNVGGIADDYLARKADAAAQVAPGDPALVPVAVEPSEGPSVAVSAVTDYLTGWLVEYSLSLDNIFVIAMIFGYFRVPAQYQHRVLFWGILGALVMRGAMIGAGAALLDSFHWIIYVFGGLLIITAVKMLLTKEDDQFDPGRSFTVRLAKRMIHVGEHYEGEKFFTHVNINGVRRRAITPLFLVLLVVETTDVIFAVDSIPAIFTITKDPFLVFTSNVFAILGLRSLYFALAGIIDRFKYIKPAIAIVLIFVGGKMLAEIWHFKIDPRLSLIIISSILATGVSLSWIKARAQEKAGLAHGTPPDEPVPPADGPSAAKQS